MGLVFAHEIPFEIGENKILAAKELGGEQFCYLPWGTMSHGTVQ
jgi:hypothetical protein